jgi:AcrR family transcriptional regulator
VRSPEIGHGPSAGSGSDRREAVLEAALTTFARFGYRKTSMDEVALSADISRPGLYFLFTSKEVLFRAAVTQALERDLVAVEHLLDQTDRPLQERVLDSFDQWAGRYVGPLTSGIAEVIDDNPDLLGPVVETAPRRFEELLIDALTADHGHELATRLAQTIISTSVGVKHQVSTREAYLERLEVALGLLLR